VEQQGLHDEQQEQSVADGEEEGRQEQRPSHIPEPTFVANPNHRRKGLTGEFIKLDMGKAQLR
jgi:hypothetical protein